MATQQAFEDAAKRVQDLSARPSNQDLLQLYALYKQASEGDVQGKRPGALNLKGRAKYDAWASMKGKSQDEARAEYVALVERLEAGS